MEKIRIRQTTDEWPVIGSYAAKVFPACKTRVRKKILFLG
jgi:hypothetical protein